MCVVCCLGIICIPICEVTSAISHTNPIYTIYDVQCVGIRITYNRIDNQKFIGMS